MHAFVVEAPGPGWGEVKDAEPDGVPGAGREPLCGLVFGRQRSYSWGRVWLAVLSPSPPPAGTPPAYTARLRPFPYAYRNHFSSSLKVGFLPYIRMPVR